MKLRTSFVLLALVASLALLFTSCTEKVVTPPVVDTKPTGIQITSFNSTSITVLWTRNVNDVSMDTIIATDTTTGAVISTTLVPSPASTGVLAGLQLGKTYDVWIGTSGGRSTKTRWTVVIDAPPTDVQVNTLSATEIAVRWIRDTSDVSTDTIIATDQSTGLVAATFTVSGGSSAGTLAGLQLNKKYDILIGSSGGRSAKITWMTATRSGILTLYETADNTPGHGSGLILGPNAETTKVTGPKKNLIDLVLASDANGAYPYISLQSASAAGSGIPSGRSTLLGDDYYFVTDGLDNDYYASGFSNQFTLGNNAYKEFGIDTMMELPVVMVVKTADNHYARVEIVPQDTNGNKLWKTVAGGFRAIDVIVSYQPTIDAAYAGRPTATRRGTNEPVRPSRRGVRK